jgi:hypothetical protein
LEEIESRITALRAKKRGEGRDLTQRQAHALAGRGEGFIEVHHAVPVHQLLPDATTKIADLHLLCANCHRMIHARRPWLTVEELKACISKSLDNLSGYPPGFGGTNV